MTESTHATLAAGRAQALAAWQRGDLARAERTFRQLLESDPDDAEALQFLATPQLERWDVTQAVEPLRAAHRGEPQDAAVLHRLGEPELRRAGTRSDSSRFSRARFW